jgi:GNAT superfamily N-acetyltransferase
MFYRVRASLHERPGALALLAARCGDAGLNILGLQIFPDLGRVTDELVISAPEDWTATAVSDLVSGAGGDEVSVEPCTTHDLIDQPTRWLAAAQDVVSDPDLLPAVLEKLLGPHPEKWTATEHSRAEALRSLAQDVDASGPQPSDTVEYDEAGSGVLARIGGHVVGAAAFAGEERPDLTVEVAPAWRRLGIGTGLLTRAVTQAAARGVDEVVLVAPAGDEGFVSWLLHAGVRARMKSVDGMVQARVATPAGPTARVR